MGGLTFADKTIIYQAFGPSTVSSAAPRYVSLKDAEMVEVVITGLNTTGVTGSAVTLNQATAVAGTNAKALAFDVYKSNIDPANSSVMTNATATSNTFTTVSTNSLAFEYRIRVDPSTLDIANSFDCLSVGLANAVNTTVAAHIHVKPKFGGNSVDMPNIAVD